jgi:alcohol dehydrogenase YqhD (iron-dependent ADH family)
MKEFTFSVPQKITVGEGSLKKLPQISREQGGTHAFIISGPHLTRMGVVDTCAEILTEAGIPVSTFTETEGNPSVQTVDAAVAKYKEQRLSELLQSSAEASQSTREAERFREISRHLSQSRPQREPAQR